MCNKSNNRKKFKISIRSLFFVNRLQQSLRFCKIWLYWSTQVNLKARVLTGKEGEYFDIKKGVRQRDPVSLLLFNCILEEVFKELEWNNKGLNINGQKFTNLRFADDVVLIYLSRLTSWKIWFRN